MSESERQRQQQEQAARILRQAMPDIDRIMRDIVSAQPAITNLNKLFGQGYQSFFRDIQHTAALQMPKIDRPKLDIKIPALKLNYPALFPDLTSVQDRLFESMKPAIEAIQTLQRSQFADVIEKAKAAVQAALPPNWRDDEIEVPPDLEALLLDEGLAAVTMDLVDARVLT
jgi:hypothetical protein